MTKKKKKKVMYMYINIINTVPEEALKSLTANLPDDLSPYFWNICESAAAVKEKIGS